MKNTWLEKSKQKLIVSIPISNSLLERANKLFWEMQNNKIKYGKFATNKEINAGGK